MSKSAVTAKRVFPYCKCGHPAIGHGPGGCSGETLRGAVWHPCKCEGQAAYVYAPEIGHDQKRTFTQIFRDFGALAVAKAEGR